jgi:hypothetical protein
MRVGIAMHSAMCVMRDATPITATTEHIGL